MSGATELEYALRMLLAFIAGGIIGFERERHKKPVGFRTYVLVCLGSAVVTMVGVETVQRAIEMAEGKAIIRTDPVRLSAQVVSGIGFLGAGTILHEKKTISGLTSAASLWAASMIGIAIGYGYYFIGIMATFLVELTLILSSLRNYFNKPYDPRDKDD
ncbi:MgtC/SapB family protein [Mycoplasmatota bacterium]|nr:MgtC/SapB family protein [Mycoplasmatota bacterium]